MTNPLLQVINLDVIIKTKEANLPVLKNINFEVQQSQTVALVGESGSGKSLTALAIMQLLPPVATIQPTSTILLNNDDLLTYSEIKMRKVRGRKIGMIFQEASTALNPVLTLQQQIEEVLSCHFDLKPSQKRERAIELLTEVGFPESKYYLNTYPHQLSGGLKQRAMIAMALAGEPDLLIADEPTTALDVTLQAQILDLLKNLQQKRNMSLIFITHDLGIVYQIAQRVVVLYKGEIVESQDAAQFFASPQHPYSKKLFASIPGWLQRPQQTYVDEEKSLLVVDDLKVYYPIRKGLFKRVVGYVKAVDGIAFKVKAGKTLALVGESGSGKTSTGMAILRLLPYVSGKVLFQNVNLATLSQRQLRRMRRDFQVVFQDPYASMNPRMLIGDIIAEGMEAQKIPRAIRNAKIDELLEYVGLPQDARQRYPHEFSGGQRQRICIARALALEPKLLVCDEPTSALDVSAQMQVLQLLLKLQQELGLAYLLITHNFAVVSYMADDICVMYQGHIVEEGKTKDVLQNPQHPYTQQLLSAVPKVPLVDKP